MRADRGTGRMKGGTAAAPALMAAAVLTAAAALGAFAALAMSGVRGAATAPATAQGPDAVPTRADLEAARVDVARLEAEQALARTRKPWVVIDIPARTLRYRLLGMDLRDVPFTDFDTHGLKRLAPGDKAPESRFLAGIFSIKEKEGDPRLSPLTPEQIEAGLDDENSADALPPDPPANYRLWFDQALVVRVNGTGAGRGVGERLRDWWRSIRRAGPRTTEGRTVHVKVEIDAAIAREIYRSLIPGGRIVVVPPRGFVLPDAGQPAPATLRPDRVRPRPAPEASPAPSPEAGVPFRLPPPEEVPNGTPPAPAPGATPSDTPAPSQSPPAGEDPARPAPPEEEAPEDAPLPDDWVPAEEEDPEP